MRDFDDTEVMAYADGELEATRAAQLREVAERDTELRARIEDFRASTRLLHATFAPVLTEPVADSLRRLVMGDPHAATRVQRAVPARRVRASWRPLALAAGVLLAVAMGVGLYPRSGPTMAGGTLLSVALHGGVLDRAPSGVPVVIVIAGDPVEVLPLASYADEEGRLCREFEASIAARSRQHGLACRESGAWGLRALPSGPAYPADDQAYRIAGSSVPASIPGLRRLRDDEEAAALRALVDPPVPAVGE